jgi:hypothetical protein
MRRLATLAARATAAAAEKTHIGGGETVVVVFFWGEIRSTTFSRKRKARKSIFKN